MVIDASKKEEEENSIRLGGQISSCNLIFLSKV